MKKEYSKPIKAAVKARQNAYAPHSGFKVGAAVLGKSGKVYAGCNVENASYGATICAERSAIVNAVSSGEKSIKAIAIVADTESLTSPCGVCRQVIQEFGPKAAIILSNLKNKLEVYSQGILLPIPFDYLLVTQKKKKK